MNRQRATFTLDSEVIKELNEISSELHMKKSHIIEKALVLYFDMLDTKIAESRLKDLEDGKSKVVSAQELYKELGLD